MYFDSTTTTKKAYFFKTVPVFPKQRQFLLTAIEKIGGTEAHLRMCGQVYYSVSRQYKEYKLGWVPISYELREKQFGEGNTDLTPLLEAGILQRSHYSKEDKKSYCYRLHIDFLDELNRIGMEEAYSGGVPVDLYTGVVLAKLETSVHDKAGNKLPDYIAEAFKSYKPLPFDHPSLIKYINAQEEDLKLIKAKYGKDSKEYEHRFYQVANVRQCYIKLIFQRPVAVGDGIFVVDPAYEMQESGRMTSKGGICQNWPREMQAAAFARVPNLHNYDLKSSQANGVIQQLEAENIDTSWLVTYRDDPEAKTKLASAIFDIESGDWESYEERKERAVNAGKSILCSTLMGADVYTNLQPKSTQNIINFLKNTGKVDECPGPVRYIYEYFQEEADFSKMHGAYKNLVRHTRPLVESLKQWHQYLIKHWLPANKKRSKKGTYVKNAYGCKMYIDGLTSRQLKCKIAAHILQGQEAYYIAAIARLGEEYGYIPVMNMHDGLLTIGEVPEEAQRRAAEMTNTRNAELIEKQFKSKYAQVDPPEIQPGELLVLDTFTAIYDPFEYALDNEPHLLMQLLKNPMFGNLYPLTYPCCHFLEIYNYSVSTERALSLTDRQRKDWYCLSY